MTNKNIKKRLNTFAYKSSNLTDQEINRTYFLIYGTSCGTRKEKKASILCETAIGLRRDSTELSRITAYDLCLTEGSSDCGRGCSRA